MDADDMQFLLYVLNQELSKHGMLTVMSIEEAYGRLRTCKDKDERKRIAAILETFQKTCWLSAHCCGVLLCNCHAWDSHRFAILMRYASQYFA